MQGGWHFGHWNWAEGQIVRASQVLKATGSSWKRGVLFVTLALVSAALLAGCGGDDSSAQPDQQQAASRTERAESQADRQQESREDRQATIQQQQQAQDRQVEVRPALPREAGEFRIARAEPINLDPAQITDVSSAVIAVEIFGGLLVLDRSLRIAPDLAESVPTGQLNSDGTVTYRFTIRDNARFHDGKRITAEDFKWSIERNLRPETLSPTAPDFLGDIVGASEFLRNRADEVVGVQVIDEVTLDITIKQQTPVFLYKLTYPTAYVLDRDQVEDDPERWALAPNGSGPFRLTDWQLGEGLTLERFDDYHLEPAKVRKVSVRFAGGSVEQFENDELDQAFIGLNDIERVRDPASELNQLYVSRSELSVFYLAFNVTQPPFDDPNVRLALAHAIDKTTIIEDVLDDLLLAAHQIVPPGLVAHNPDYRGIVFDPELAQDLLAESRYAGTTFVDEIRLTIPGAGATPGSVFEAIQDMWRQHLGLEIEIQQVEFATFISEVDRGLYGFFSLGWSLDYPDPHNVLDYKFHSASLGNDTQLDSEEIDSLLEQARYSLDNELRTGLYQEVDRMLVEDAIWIPLYFSVAHEVVKPYVRDYEPTRMVITHLRFVSIEE
ncbi:MAG: peptide ABC transporter substrate-binding protein [Chloroflexi bacterium]|nr:peptide ABC transporter substrate-binding protein [Chloroflexota bacterium]MYF22143.1 peptide ABC transporter substrate-binding protein [Chloroflexota bacterium]